MTAFTKKPKLDDVDPLSHRINSYDKSSYITKFFFSWVVKFLTKNYGKDIDVNDLTDCPKDDSSQKLGEMLTRNWDKKFIRYKHGKGPQPNLLWALVKTFGPRFLLNMIFSIIDYCGIQMLLPLFLAWLVADVTRANKLPVQDSNSNIDYKHQDHNYDNVYIYAAGVLFLSLLHIWVGHPVFFFMQRLGMQIRVALCNIVYRKSLRLSGHALQKTTVGQIVNLLSNDVQRFDAFMDYIQYLVVGPLQILIAIGILWQHLSFVTLAGISVLLLYIPLQALMGKQFSKLRTQSAPLTDERVRLMNEIVPAMRVIKMYTWETPFSKFVQQARENEINVIRKAAFLRGVNLSLYSVLSKFILLLCFAIYVLNGEDLTAEVVFLTMSLVNQLRFIMTLCFPTAVSLGAETLISIKRIQEFLLLEEMEECGFVDKTNLPTKPSETGVWLSNVVATWSQTTEERSEHTLSNISLAVKAGQLSVVVGQVGSGKSSVLMTVLGELPTISGTVKVRGKVAYASQEPWIFTGTIRENIIFGSQYDDHRYRHVLHVCALERDLTLFPDGDKSLVGQRGVSLSGGQRARINLARALYTDADVFLLDDPLSAVDSEVAKHIFEKCIRGYLRKKVVILVTHQLQFIKAAHHILVLKDGHAVEQGTYNQLINKGVDIVKYAADEFARETEGGKSNLVRSGSISSDHYSISNRGGGSSLSFYGSQMTVSSGTSDAIDEISCQKLGGESVGDAYAVGAASEMQVFKSVSSSLYWLYIRLGAGPILVPILLASNFITQILFSGSDYYLSLWTDIEEQKLNSNKNETLYSHGQNVLKLGTKSDNIFTDLSTFSTETHATIYGVLVALLFICALIRTTSFFTICMRASINLHNRLFANVIRAPISFFDENPIGILLNRYSRDLGIVDDLLPKTSYDFIEIFGNTIGVVVLIAIIDYWTIVPAIVLLVVLTCFRRFFVATLRQIKKLEGATRSPVYTHLSTSLYGLSTIRAFNVQTAFEEKFDNHQDLHSSAWFLFLSTFRWSGVIIDYFCLFYVAMATILPLLDIEDKSAAKIGLAISSAINLTQSFSWGVRLSSEVEALMSSVERLDEYSHLPEEAQLEAPHDKKPPENWPQEGKITFNNVSLQYKPDDAPVLKSLSFDINAAEKIGIVGRTGAGKSSVISVLFRMTEPDGCILIDGVDTKSIGLHDLRRKISIIPQEPILFTGTVRQNIDPFNESNDERLWEILDKVQLRNVVKDLPGKLDARLSEGGSNFSVGQRQLICLARAILRQNRILVLDEATASVDPKTDALIQQTIREEFGSCTVLTIAHRLNTIMDSGRVLVLDAGSVVEFDEPHALLQDEDGIFTSMVKMTGKLMTQQLKEIAHQTWIRNHGSSPINSGFGSTSMYGKEKTLMFHPIEEVITIKEAVKKDQ